MQRSTPLPLEIDLSDLTFADLDGQRSLVSLRRMGANFRAEGVWAEIVQENAFAIVTMIQVVILFECGAAMHWGLLV